METRAEILRNNRTLTELIIGIFIFDIWQTALLLGRTVARHDTGGVRGSTHEPLDRQGPRF